MFERKSSCPANTTHLYDIYTTSAQRRRPNVFDVGSTLYKVSDQVGAKAFELLTHRCLSSIYELAVI